MPVLGAPWFKTARSSPHRDEANAAVVLALDAVVSDGETDEPLSTRLVTDGRDDPAAGLDPVDDRLGDA